MSQHPRQMWLVFALRTQEFHTELLSEFLVARKLTKSLLIMDHVFGNQRRLFRVRGLTGGPVGQQCLADVLSAVAAVAEFRDLFRMLRKKRRIL